MTLWLLTFFLCIFLAACVFFSLYKSMFQKIGFASCERKIGATEGINVLIERKKLDGQWAYGVTCIEYTEFENFFITDTPISPTRYYSLFVICNEEMCL